MKARRAGSRLALYAFVVALLLKGAVPLFASWSAHLQGKGVAEVCDIYGVALPGRAGHGEHAVHDVHAMHALHVLPAGHDMHAMHVTQPSPADIPPDEPHRHEPGSHAGDHCVLTALVAFADVGGDGPSLQVAQRRDVLHALAWAANPIGVDASARWAARLGHGPPSIS